MDEFRMRKKAGIKLNAPVNYYRGKVRGRKKDWVYSFIRVRANGLRAAPYWDIDGFEVIPETVTAWTGKYDEHMTAIFGGDILRYKCEDENGKECEEFYLVHWNDELGGYALGGEKGEDCGGMEDVPEFEVIGNVFDNPELAAPFLNAWEKSRGENV